MSPTSLFHTAFAPTSTEEWIEAIRAELGYGRDLNSLAWEPERGLRIDPFYRADDVQGPFGYPAGTHTGWLICDRYAQTDLSSLSRDLQASARGGADAVEISFADDLLPETAPSDEGVRISEVLVTGDESMLDACFQLKQEPQPRTYPSLRFLYDPLHSAGTPAERWERFDLAAQMLLPASETSSAWFGSADARPLFSRGAGVSSVLAYLLASVSEWGHTVVQDGKQDGLWAQRLTCVVPVGNVFYLHIAGLRALRILLPQVIRQYVAKDDPVRIPRIYAVSESGDAHVKDPAGHLISETTRALSAVLGGADMIGLGTGCSSKNDPSNVEARRLARNVQLLLRHEALLDRVADPLSGSYYIETVTDRIARRAWEKFLAVEHAGGLVQAAGNGVLERWIQHDQQAAASASEDTQ